MKPIYCENCGAEIHDTSRCSMYRAGGPYYETIYICEDCKGEKIEETDEMMHVDMDDGEVI